MPGEPARARRGRRPGAPRARLASAHAHPARPRGGAPGGRPERRPRPLPAAAPPTAALLTAVRARELGRRAVVVGDRVAVVGDTGGGPDALGRIVRVETRTSLLRRTPDDSDPVERAVVANAEVLVVVTALADPVPRPRLVDRCLVAAYDGGLVPLLCLTKDDLAPPDEMRALYEPLGVEVVVTGPGAGRPGRRAAARRGWPAARACCSGSRASARARWSTGWCRTPTGPSATVTGVGKGRHTSSSAVALELPGGGTVIDTPGVRSFGLGAVTPERVLAAFPDLAEAAARVPARLRPPRGHAGLRARRRGRATGGASAARLDSLRRLLVALLAQED